MGRGILLETFEQDTDIVIGILENSLKSIAKWNNDLGKTDLRFIAKRSINDVIKIIESFAPFGDAFPQLLRFLTIRIPEFKCKVEDGYSKITDKIQEIVHRYGQDPMSVLSDQAKSWVGSLYVDMCELRSYTENLRNDLDYCVRTAKEQQQSYEKKGHDNDVEKDSLKEKSSDSRFWKLYEKTIKALFDAILDKIHLS